MRIRWLAVCLFVLSCLSASLFGTSLRLLSLEDTLARSSRVVVGECLGFREGFDRRGLPFTEYTFRLIEGVKGYTESSAFSIRQFGRSPESTGRAAGRRLTRISGMPHYLAGATYMLFLGPTSRLGFTSPVGLAQGVFRVTGTGRHRRVVNGVGNRNLLIDTTRSVVQRVEARRSPQSAGTGPAAAEPIEGSVPYDRFSDALKRMMRGDRLEHRLLREVLTEEGGAQ